jgi:glycosyltransferase involved in cell wall biosynthesis
MKPRASIVMPCYNAAAHIQASIGSVLAQTLQDWELLVVDDGSTDSSWRILKTLALQDPRIQIFQQANAGASASRNRALREAQGT